MMMMLAMTLVMGLQDEPAPNPDTKVICRTVGVTGSRVRSERICKTAAEWVAYRGEARRHVEQLQNQRGTAVQDNDLGNAGRGGI
ncbi:MAG: hypothetical protein ACAH11_13095 [Sphingomonas sp.]